MAIREERIALDLFEVSELPSCTPCVLRYAPCAIASSVVTRIP